MNSPLKIHRVQPSELYFQRRKEDIPKSFPIGRTVPGNSPVFVNLKDLDRHLTIKGKSGFGKTRLLAIILIILIASGKKVIFIDPLGAAFRIVLDWWSNLTSKYKRKSGTQWEWFQEQLPNTMFWDLSKGHSYRHNMLKPFKGETINDVTSRQVKFIDSLVSSESGRDGMDLQLNRRSNYVSLITIFAWLGISLKESRKFIYNRDFRDMVLKSGEKKKALSEELEDAIEHFRFLENEFKGRFGEKLASLETLLSPFYEHPIIKDLLLTSENDIDFQDIMDNKSLFMRIPADCSLPVRRLLLNYMYTVFLDLGARRSDEDPPIYLGSDESALVFSSQLADYITRGRNFKVRIISSFQQRGQMITPEGMNLAKTIEDMSFLLPFKVSYEEAIDVVNEYFPLTGRRPKDIEITTTITQTAGKSSGTSISEQHSRQKSSGLGYSLQDGVNQTSTQNYSLTDSESITEGINQQWTEGVNYGEVETWNVSDAFTYQESLSTGMSRISTDGFSSTQSKSGSLAEMETEFGALTIAESEGRTETSSEAHGQSEGEGTNESYSKSEGGGRALNLQVSNGGKMITVIEGSPIAVGKPATGTVGETISDYKNETKSFGRQSNQSLQNIKGTASSVSKALSKARAHGITNGISLGHTNTAGFSMLKQLGESISFMKSYARSVQKSLGHSKAFSRSKSFNKSIGSTISRANARAVTRGESIALSTLRNLGVNINQTMGEGLSQGKTHSFNVNSGISISISWKIVYYTLEEERHLSAQDLMRQGIGNFHLLEMYGPQKMIAANCFILPTHDNTYDYKRSLMLFYKNPNPKIVDFKLVSSEKTSKKIIKDAVLIVPEYPRDFLDFLP